MDQDPQKQVEDDQKQPQMCAKLEENAKKIIIEKINHTTTNTFLDDLFETFKIYPLQEEVIINEIECDEVLNSVRKISNFYTENIDQVDTYNSKLKPTIKLISEIQKIVPANLNFEEQIVINFNEKIKLFNKIKILLSEFQQRQDSIFQSINDYFGKQETLISSMIIINSNINKNENNNPQIKIQQKEDEQENLNHISNFKTLECENSFLLYNELDDNDQIEKLVNIQSASKTANNTEDNEQQQSPKNLQEFQNEIKNNFQNQLSNAYEINKLIEELQYDYDKQMFDQIISQLNKINSKEK